MGKSELVTIAVAVLFRLLETIVASMKANGGKFILGAVLKEFFRLG